MIETFIDVIRPFINLNDVRYIIDVGSRDAAQAAEFCDAFPYAVVYAFECNPILIERCEQTALKYLSHLRVVPSAVREFDGECDFWAIDPEKTVTSWADGNPGASSLFKANGAYDHIEKYVQKKITVPCCRLDSWAHFNWINYIDLMWMDLQGAELLALQGMGDLLKTVKAIHTEVEVNPMYEGQCLFKDVHTFLTDKGFRLIYGDTSVTFGTDLVYINKDAS